MSETVHLAPTDECTTACCGRTVFELSRTDRLTEDVLIVTCPGRAS